MSPPPLLCKPLDLFRRVLTSDTLKLALQASGCDRVEVVHKPRLLSDNGSSYIAGDLADWLFDQGMVRPTSAAHRTIPRPRARSSVGTRP